MRAPLSAFESAFRSETIIPLSEPLLDVHVQEYCIAAASHVIVCLASATQRHFPARKLCLCLLDLLISTFHANPLGLPLQEYRGSEPSSGTLDYRPDGMRVGDTLWWSDKPARAPHPAPQVNHGHGVCGWRVCNCGSE